MAEEETAEEEEQSGGGKKKIIIIVVALLLLVGIGVAVMFMMGGSGGEDGDDEESDEMEDDEAGELPAAVLALETFVVNLQVKGAFLKTTIQLEFVEPEAPATIQSDIPKIRDSVIRILSSKSSEEILTAAGKEAVREEIRDGINEAIGADDVAEIYFTEFIIQ